MRYLTERREDFIAAAVTAATGAFIIFEASSYSMGTLSDMGPGFFPVILGWLMVILASVMALTAQPGETAVAVSLEQVRGTLFVAAGFIAFAFTVEPLGMFVSVFLVVFLSALGNRNTSFVIAAMLALGTAIFSVVVFRYALGLQIKAF